MYASRDGHPSTSAVNCRPFHETASSRSTALRYTASMMPRGNNAVRNVRIGVLDNDACAVQYIKLMLNQLNHRNGLELSLWSTTFPTRAIQECQSGNSPTDILLLDMALNGVTGPQVARILHQVSPTTAIIGMTSYEPELYRAEASQAGIPTILDKTTLSEQLSSAITDILHTPRPAFAPATAPTDLEATTMPRLTNAEQRILTLSASGLNAKQIATRLGISADTVFSHRRNIKTKFHASDWHDVIATCRRAHII